MQWEYLVLHVIYAAHAADTKVVIDGSTAHVPLQGLGEALNELGAEEWEAFGVVGETQGAIKHVFLKRPYARDVGALDENANGLPEGQAV